MHNRVAKVNVEFSLGLTMCDKMIKTKFTC